MAIALQFQVFEECQKSWKAIVIDEFQDTSAMQYSLLRILSSHNCVTIVGDDDQVYFLTLVIFIVEALEFPSLSHLYWLFIIYL